jgi:hypothetical protein
VNEAGSGASLTPTSKANSAFNLTGGVFIIDDTVSFDAVNMEPLPGGPLLIKVRSLQGEVSELGSIELESPPVTMEVSLLEGAPLLGGYEALVLEVPSGDENLANTGEIVIPIPTQVSSRFNLLFEVAGAGPQDEEILQGLAAQGSHYTSHLGFALDAIAAENLAGTRSHSEHVINILSGRNGEFYGDWNGNELVENPGDDVGLIVYLTLLDDLLQGPLVSSDEGTRQAAEELEEQLQGQIAQANQALTLARQLGLADTIQVIHELGIDQEIKQLTFNDQLAALVETARKFALAYYLPLE